MRQRGQAVEEARRRDGQADARLLGQVARDGSRVAGVLLVAERDDADAGGLRHAPEVGDRNARHAVDRRQPVELQRIDDEVEAIGQFALGLGGCGNALDCCGHSAFSLIVSWVEKTRSCFVR